MNASEPWSSKSSSRGYGTQSSSTCTPQRERHSETGTASQTQTMKYKDAAKAEDATVSMRWLMRWSDTPKCRRASSSTAKSDPGPLANVPLASAHTGASTGTGNAHPAWSSRQCFPTVPRCVGYWRPGDPAVSLPAASWPSPAMPARDQPTTSHEIHAGGEATPLPYGIGR